jgi:hypothetical protein
LLLAWESGKPNQFKLTWKKTVKKTTVMVAVTKSG